MRHKAEQKQSKHKRARAREHTAKHIRGARCFTSVVLKLSQSHILDVVQKSKKRNKENITMANSNKQNSYSFAFCDKKLIYFRYKKHMLQ